MKLGDAQDVRVDSISTGSPSLDAGLGMGGIPKGRVTEIFGAESAGKSTLAIHIMAETQKSGGIAAYIDVEHALDPNYANNCGLDLDGLLIAQPDSAEQALDITRKALGEEHPKVAIRLNNLAQLYKAQVKITALLCC